MKRFLTSDTRLSKKEKNTVQNVDDPDPVAVSASTMAEIIEHSGVAEMSNSYLFDGEFYKIVSIDGIKVSAICTICSKTICGHKTSTGNFLNHIKVSGFIIYIRIVAK